MAALQATQSQPLDFLYCHEEILVDLGLTKTKFHEEEEEEEEEDDYEQPIISSSYEDDDYNEHVFLISKEEREQPSFDQTPLMVFEIFRKESVEWMMMVNTHLGFSIPTLVLAVNYFDRFSRVASSFLEIPAIDDEHCNATNFPWITQLVSVACLSLASKVQETHVPLLLDFQIECRYVFQPKTVMKMELLVMSTLEWKMNPVTPFSYFEHLTRRLKWKSYWQQEILSRSENLLLSFIADPGYLCYPPSVIAASLVLHAMEELDLWSTMESEILLIDAFKMSKEKVEECCKFITELSNNNQKCKRRRICSSHIDNLEKPTEWE
ncbi:hypothetical protein V2J09_021925 [Rumex salicifolius]